MYKKLITGEQPKQKYLGFNQFKNNGISRHSKPRFKADMNYNYNFYSYLAQKYFDQV